MKKTIALITTAAVSFLMTASSAQAMFFPIIMPAQGGDVTVVNTNSSDVTTNVDIDAASGDVEADGGESGDTARGGDAYAEGEDITRAIAGDSGDTGSGGSGGVGISGDVSVVSSVTNQGNYNEITIAKDDCDGCSTPYAEFYSHNLDMSLDQAAFHDYYYEDTLHSDTRDNDSFTQTSHTDDLVGTLDIDYDDETEQSSDDSSHYWNEETGQWERHDNEYSDASSTNNDKTVTENEGCWYNCGGETTTEWNKDTSDSTWSSEEGASNDTTSETVKDSGHSDSSSTDTSFDLEAGLETHSTDNYLNDENHDSSVVDEKTVIIDNQGATSDLDYHESTMMMKVPMPQYTGNMTVMNHNDTQQTTNVDIDADSGDVDVNGGDSGDTSRGGDADAIGADDEDGWSFFSWFHHDDDDGDARAVGGDSGDTGSAGNAGAGTSGAVDVFSNVLNMLSSSIISIVR